MLNRIVGILVLLAAGILIYPFIFNPHEHLVGQKNEIKAPPFPGIQSQNVTIKALDQKTEEAAVTAVKTIKVKDKKIVKIPLKAVAWVIQVGTPQEKVKALRLVNQLRAKGYNAFIHQTKAAFGETLQVYIGPETKKDSAASLASKLAKETKLSSVVKTYKLLRA